MYVPPLGSCELGGFNELITSRFGRHLKNRMLGFPAQILPMMGFSSCDNSDIFQWLKLVSIGGSCSEPFSHLQCTMCLSKSNRAPVVFNHGVPKIASYFLTFTMLK